MKRNVQNLLKIIHFLIPLRKGKTNFGKRIIGISGLMVLLSFTVGCSNDDDAAPVPDPELTLGLVLIAEGMTSPIGLTEAPNDSGWLYVIDQAGEIWIIDETGERLEEPFLDVSDRILQLDPTYDEKGLLGLAFHPEYNTNGRFFVYYTAPPNPGGPEAGESWNNISRISEFTVSASNPAQANPGSERKILEIDQPQGNHEGGTVAFGPDDYLYISIGDGGASDDVGPGHVEDWYEVNAGGNGQDIESNLLGDILRIDVDGEMPYGIPPDNPFIDQPGLDEIYAFGFRNPFRFSFDMGGSNHLLVGDAGQALWEEISLVERGGNYGWNVMEGTHCFDASDNENTLESCPETDVYGNELIDPVIEMANSNNPEGGQTVTIIGGYVYRGQEVPELSGKYIFGSFSRDFEPTGEIFMATPAGQGPWSFEEVNLNSYDDHLGYYLKGFGQDAEGEVYLTVSSELGPDGNTGRVYKLQLVEE